MLRLSIRLVISVMLLLAIAVAGLGVYTQTAHFRVWLQEQVRAALQASVHGEVTIAEVSGSLWTELVFHHLVIHQHGGDTLAVPRVGVTIQVLPRIYSLLRFSTLHIATLTLTAPSMTLRQDPDTGWNLAHLLKPDQPHLLDLYVEQIRAEAGRMDLHPAVGEKLSFSALAFDGTLALLSSGTQVELTTLDFVFSRAALPEVQGTAALSYDDTRSPALLQLRHLDVHTPESLLRVSGTVHDLAAPTLALVVEAERLAATELRTLLPTVPLQQDLSGTLRVTGPFSALELVTTLEAANGYMTAAVTADMRQPPPHYQGSLTIERFAVDKVLAIATVAGEVSGQLSFSGAPPATAQAAGHVTASDVRLYGRQVGNLTVTGDFDTGRLTLSGEAQGLIGQVQWQGHVTLDPPLTYEATLTVRQLDVAHILGGAPALAAQLNGDAWVKGHGIRLEELDTTVQITLLPSQLGTITLSRGRLVGTVRREQVVVDEATLVASDTTLTAKGQLGRVRDTADRRLTYTLRTRNIAPWVALVGTTGEGGVELRGSLRGALDNLRLEGKATVSNLHFAGVSCQDGVVTYTLTGVGSPQPRGQVRATLNHLQAGVQLRTVEATLALTARHPLEIHVDMHAQDTGMRTHRVQARTRYHPDRLEILVQDLVFQFPAGAWRLPTSARLVWQDDALTIDELLLQRAEQMIRIAGKGGRQGTQDFTLQVQRFPLAELRPFLETAPDFSGHLQAEIHVRGTAAAPQIGLAVNADALTIANQPYAGLAVQATYGQERLDLTLRLQQDAAHSLTIEGGMPLYLGWAGPRSPTLLGEANLRARSAGLSLAFLNLLSEELREVQGTLSMNVHIRGPLHALVPSGEVQLHQGQVRVIPLGVIFRDMQLQLQLAADALHLRQFSARAGAGRLSGSGTLSLEQYAITAIALTLNADRFRVVNTRQYVAAVSGRLVCSGSLHAPSLRGTLDLRDTTLRPDLAFLRSDPIVAPDPTIIVVQSEQELAALVSAALPTEEPVVERLGFPRLDLYRPLALDLTVTVPRNTWVHVPEGSLELIGHLHLRKNPAEELLLSGRIETLRGWYTLHGRRFRLERGLMTFAAESPINPSIDVVARYTLPRSQVDVIIGGTAHTPTLSFRSDPQLEEADILSLLVFGRLASALTEGEKVSLQSQALKTTLGFVVPDLQRSIARQLGVDLFEFEVGETPLESRLGVGKYLTEDIFVTTARRLGEQPEQEFAIEYHIDTTWQLKSSTTSKGSSSIDLFWQKRY